MRPSVLIVMAGCALAAACATAPSQASRPSELARLASACQAAGGVLGVSESGGLGASRPHVCRSPITAPDQPVYRPSVAGAPTATR